MIISFKHKGLKDLYERDSTRGVLPEHAPKLRRILSVLDVAQIPQDVDLPGYRLHRLAGKYSGHWSVWVNGNWRVTFRFIENDIELVDYQDYH